MVESTSNAALLDRYWRALNDRDRRALADVLADDVHRHNPGGEEIRGVANFVDAEMSFLEAFPATLEVEHLVADSDLVAVHYQATGTHEAAVSGIEPTGETVEYRGLELFRVADDEIVESWHYGDVNDIYEVLGFTRELDDLKVRKQYREVLGRVLRHNIRNELEVVRGAIELLPSDDPDVAEVAAMVEEAVEELLGVASKTRSLAQATVERDFEPRSVDLGAVADATADRWTDSVPGGMVTADSPASPVTATTDPVLLEAVLGEVVENALEHAARDDPTVVIRVRSPADEDGAEIVVEDDGPGIPAHELDPLERGGETPLIHGSGIGLWTVAWGVERLNGEVSFESVDPTGTTVQIRLPPEP